MVRFVIVLLLISTGEPWFKRIVSAPINDEDEMNEKSYKRQLELFENEVQDNWEHDDHEYLSQRELNDAKDEETKNSQTSLDDENDKRWIDVDMPDKSESTENNSPAVNDKLPKNGEIFQGDIVMDDYVRSVFDGEAEKRDAVNIRKYRWKNGIVYYRFHRRIDRISKMEIKRAMRLYRKYTCIRFKRKRLGDGVKDYVRFISNGSACYSFVGRRGGRQDVSIGSGCYRVGTSIHEIMHVLGFFHEMARPDRDEYIKIHWKYIKKKLRHNFRKIPKSLDLNLVPYNLNSLMHYSNDAFSKDGYHHTITSLEDPEREFGQRKDFSVGDIKQINKLYGCPQYNKRFAGAPITTVLKE